MEQKVLRSLLATLLAVSLMPCEALAGGGGGGGAPALPVTIPGTVHSNIANAKAGDTVTLTVTPNEGYELESITVTDADGNNVPLTDNGDGTYSFTMPDAVPVKITPIIAAKKTGTLTGQDGKTVRWVRQSDGQIVVEGDVSGANPVLVASYNAQGKMLSLTWLNEPGRADVSGGHTAKLFWLADPAIAKPKTENAVIPLTQ